MVTNAYQVFVGLDATALEGGYIYIGQPYTDPELQPVPLFWDAAKTTPAAQPLRTSGGVIVRDGTPSDVYSNVSAYSIRVRDKTRSVVWYKPTTGGISADRMTFPIPGGPAGADSVVPGPADNTYTTLAALLASDPARKSARLVPQVDETAPAGNFNYIGGKWTRQTSDGVTYDGRSVGDKLFERVSVKDVRFAGGANSDAAADATAAFNAAKLSGKQVNTPGVAYIVNNAALDQNYQEWAMQGAVWRRSATTAPVVTVTGRGNRLNAGFIDGNAGSGDNIVLNGQETDLRLMSNRNTTGRAVYALNANGTKIIGGVHKTENTAADGYDIVFEATNLNDSLYNTFVGIITNQNSGGMRFTRSYMNFVVGCQIGKFRVDNGGGALVASTRIGGIAEILNASSFANVSFAKDIVIGQDGQTPNVGNIGIGPTCFLQAGNTIDIGNNVVESSFHLDQMVHPTTTINIRSPDNAIYLRGQPFAPLLGAKGGSATLGNSTSIATMAYMGWQRNARIVITFGDGVNFGTGEFYIAVPLRAASTALGKAIITSGGKLYAMTARMMAGSNQIYFVPDSGETGTNAPATGTTPTTLVSGGILEIDIWFEQAKRL